MTDSKNVSKDCSKKCYEEYQECIQSGEHHSVCQMKRVPCICNCSSEE